MILYSYHLILTLSILPLLFSHFTSPLGSWVAVEAHGLYDISGIWDAGTGWDSCNASRTRDIASDQVPEELAVAGVLMEQGDT